MRRVLKSLVLTALTFGLLGGDIARLSFEPAAAEARWRSGGINYGYGYRGRYGHVGYYRHRASVGDVIATAAVIAGVAAVASSISRDRRDDDRWERRDDRGWDRGRDRRDRREDIAIDECRDEAERQARSYGTSASLRDIYDVDSRGRDVRVRGVVEIATTVAVASGTERRLNSERFTCLVSDGLVESYQLEPGGFASR
ncbi:MAG: hypothetical protein Q7J32_16820 [Sphingomonadaceae bacterium]|nr:hypothetical protein [Sphingomonadaceae bacterium]